MDLRRDALRPRRHVLMPQHQHLSTREAAEKSSEVLGVQAPRKIGVGTGVTQLQPKIPLALLFERQRSFESLRLQPVLPRPQIVGIGAVDGIAKHEDQLDLWQYARDALSD